MNRITKILLYPFMLIVAIVVSLLFVIAFVILSVVAIIGDIILLALSVILFPLIAIIWITTTWFDIKSKEEIIEIISVNRDGN